MPPIPLGAPMRGFVIGVVDASRTAGWEPGDIAFAFMMKMPRADGISLEAWICALAMNGHTAYYGMLLKGRLVRAKPCWSRAPPAQRGRWPGRSPGRRARAWSVDGIENAFASLGMLFDGRNQGNLLVRIAADIS